MSQFSNQFQTALEEAGLSQTDACEKTKISSAQMSRYVSGENRPEQDSLELLLKLFDERNRTALLLAYLNDDIPAKYRRLVAVTPGESSRRTAEEPPLYRTQMPRRLRAALDFVGERSIDDERAATVLINTADLLKGTSGQ